MVIFLIFRKLFILRVSCDYGQNGVRRVAGVFL